MQRDENVEMLEPIEPHEAVGHRGASVPDRRGAPDWFWPVIAVAVIVIAVSSVLTTVRYGQLVRYDHVLVCHTVPDRC